MKVPGWVLPAGSVVAVGIAVTVAIAHGDEPQSLQDLQRAQRSGERAGSAGERIVANLERIRNNLEAGAGLSEKAGQIHDLTEKQSHSLEALADLLQDQLETLRKATQSLEETQGSAENVGRLGAEQLAILKGTVAALEDLKRSARYSTRTSGELARLALYGARLAEDSQKRFSQ